MDIRQCPNGHYYDAQRYPDGCPYCQKKTTVVELRSPAQDSPAPKGAAVRDEEKTLPLSPDAGRTMPLDVEATMPLYPDEGAMIPLADGASDPDGAEGTLQNIKRCQNNHLYNGDRFSECPYCKKDVVITEIGKPENASAPTPQPNFADEGVTTPLPPQPNFAGESVTPPQPAPYPGDTPMQNRSFDGQIPGIPTPPASVPQQPQVGQKLSYPSFLKQFASKKTKIAMMLPGIWAAVCAVIMLILIIAEAADESLWISVALFGILAVLIFVRKKNVYSAILLAIELIGIVMGLSQGKTPGLLDFATLITTGEAIAFGSKISKAYKQYKANGTLPEQPL